jgi:hypothetical protein
MKILVVATEPLDKSTADQLVGDAEQTEVFVLAPTVVDSKIGYWVSDTDEAQAEANETVRRSVANLSSRGAEASGHAGDIDPRVAVDDALRTFDPDRILVIKHSEESESYREDELLDHLNGRVTIPIEVRQVPAQVHGD